MLIKLKDLVAPWVSDMDSEIVVSGVQTDSRKVKAGDLFLAIHDAFQFGQKYIDDAIAKGAAAILYDSEKPLNTLTVPSYYMPSLAQYIGPLASRFYQYPSQFLNPIGITGTNGKTTIAYLLTQAFELLGKKSYYVGTLGQGPISDIQDTGMTTPDAIELQNICYQAKQQGYEQLTMEVSSHALEQHRVDGIPFQQVIFTNLTHDHLDYHGTIEAYARAKSRLFEWDNLDSVIVNADDEWSALMLKKVKPATQIYQIGIKNMDANIHVLEENWSLHGMHLKIKSPWGVFDLNAKLLGDFNVYNILMVFASLMSRGFAPEQVLSAIAKLLPPTGRMEIVNRQPLVLVDFAHTPDALEKALQTLRHFKNKTRSGRLWIIFGCGGDRDPLKRPIMGNIAAKLADVVVVTSDNPRNEKPGSILEQIAQGIPPSVNSLIIEDRKLAILSCLEQASKDDIVLIAGKGHENYQILGSIKTYFSDQAIVKDYYKG